MARLPDIPVDAWTGYLQDQFSNSADALSKAMEFRMSSLPLLESMAADPLQSPVYDAYDQALQQDSDAVNQQREEERRRLEEEQQRLQLEAQLAQQQALTQHEGYQQHLQDGGNPGEPVPLNPYPDVQPDPSMSYPMDWGQPSVNPEGEITSQGMVNPLYKGTTDPQRFAQAGDTREMSTGFGKPYDPAEIEASRQSFVNALAPQEGQSFKDYSEGLMGQLEPFVPKEEPNPADPSTNPGEPDPVALGPSEADVQAAQTEPTAGMAPHERAMLAMADQLSTLGTTVKNILLSPSDLQGEAPLAGTGTQQQFERQREQAQVNAENPPALSPIARATTEEVKTEAEHMDIPGALQRYQDDPNPENAAYLAGGLMRLLPNAAIAAPTEAFLGEVTGGLGKRPFPNPLGMTQAENVKVRDVVGNAMPGVTSLAARAIPEDISMRDVGSAVGVEEGAKFGLGDVLANVAPTRTVDALQAAGVIGMLMQDPSSHVAQAMAAPILLAGARAGLRGVAGQRAARAAERDFGGVGQPSAGIVDTAGQRSVDVTPERLAEISDEAARMTADPDIGGSTVNVRDGDMAAYAQQTGKPLYSVSIYPDRGEAVTGRPSAEQLQDFAQRNQDLLRDPRNSLGTWFDNEEGKTFVDVAVTVPDRRLAYYLGDLYDQKAIFDLQNFNELRIGGSGDTRLPAGLPIDPNERLTHALQSLEKEAPTTQSMYPVGGPGDVTYREVKNELGQSPDGNIPAARMQEILGTEKAPDIDTVRGWAQAGWRESQWYKKAAEIIRPYIDPTAAREFGDLVGITTQSSPAHENIPSALFLYGAARKLSLEGKQLTSATLNAELQRFVDAEMPVVDPKTGKKAGLWISTGAAGTKKAEEGNMLLYASKLYNEGGHEVKVGSKSVAFDNNIIQDFIGSRDPNTTIDRHIYDIFGYPKKGFGTDANQKVQAIYKALAEEAGVPPAEYQAATWVGYKFPGLNTEADLVKKPGFETIANYAKEWGDAWKQAVPDKPGPGLAGGADYQGLTTPGTGPGMSLKTPYYAKPLSAQQVEKEGAALLERDPRVRADLEHLGVQEDGRLPILNQPHSVLIDESNVYVPIHNGNELSTAYAAAKIGKSYNIPYVEVNFPGERASRYIQEAAYDRTIADLEQYYGRERSTVPPPRAQQQPSNYYSAQPPESGAFGSAERTPRLAPDQREPTTGIGAPLSEGSEPPASPAAGRVPGPRIDEPARVGGVGEGTPIAAAPRSDVVGGAGGFKPGSYIQSTVAGAAAGGVGAAREEGATPESVARGVALGAAQGIAGRALNRGNVDPWAASVIRKAKRNVPWEPLYGDKPKGPAAADEPSVLQRITGKVEEVRAGLSHALFDNRTYMNRLQELAEKPVAQGGLGRKLTYEENMSALTRRNTNMMAKVSIDEGLRPAVQKAGEDIDSFREIITYLDNQAVANATAGKVYASGIGRRLDSERRVRVLERKQGNGTATEADIRDLYTARQDLAHDVAVREGESWQDAAMAAEGRKFSGDLDLRESEYRLQYIRNDIGEERWKNLMDASDDVQEWVDGYRQKMFDTGMIDDKALKGLRDYSYYIPTRIVDYIKDEANVATGGRISLQDRGIHESSIKGTTREREDPIQSLIRMAYDVEGRVSRNEAFNAFHKLHKEAPELFPAERWSQGKTVPADDVGFRSPVIAGYVNGEKVAYKLNTPELAEALRVRTDPWVSNITNSVIGKGATFLREAITRHPAFIAGQIPLDAFGALVRETAMEGNIGHAPAVFMELARAYHDVWGGLKAGEFKGDLARMLKEGAGMAGYQDTTAKGLRTSVEDLQRTSVFNSFDIRSPEDVGRVAKWIGSLEASQAFGQRTEMAPRLAAFRLAEKRMARDAAKTGKAVDPRTSGLMAAMEARDVTIDFQKGGWLTKLANSFIPFFNVGFQGAAQIPRMYKANPVGTTAAFAAMVGLPTVLAEAWNRSTPEMAQDYEDIPSYVKQRNLIIMAPILNGTNKDGSKRPGVLTLPMRELAPVMLASRLAARGVIEQTGGNVNDNATWQSAFWDLANTTSPVTGSSPGDLGQSFIPYGLSTYQQLTSNRDTFRNRDIATERNDEAASPIAKALAETAYKMGLDWRPSQMEFAIRDLTGHSGSAVLAVPSAAAELAGQKEREETGAGGLPLVGGLAKRFVGSGSGGERLSQAREAQISGDTRELLHQYGLRPDSVAPVPGKLENITLTRAEQTRWQSEFNVAFEEELAKTKESSAWARAETNADYEELIRKAANAARSRTGKNMLKDIPYSERRERKGVAA